MKKYILAICSLFFVGFVKAQDKELRLSLEQAVAYAIKNSYNSKIAENNILLAKKKKWETTTMGLPQINAKIDYQYFLKQPVSLLPAAAFDNTSSVVKTVEDFFGLTSSKKPTKPKGFIPVVFGTKQNVNASATLSQLIFDGSYFVGLQSAKTYLKISEQAKEKTELATREAVINAYGNVLVAERSASILTENQKTVTKLLSDSKEIYKNGLNEEEDVEQLEITLGTIKNNLSNAKRLTDIAYKMLNIALGNTIDTPLKLTDNLDDLALTNTDLSLISQPFNINNHIDFKIAENDRQAKKLMLRYQKTKALPTLTGFINYGYTANSNSFTFFNSDQKWFGSSLLGISLNIPIFSSLRRSAKTAQAKIELSNADLKLKELKEKLNLEAQAAKSEYQMSVEKYGTAKKNLALAKRIEKKQTVKFLEGISSSFELLQAQNQLYAQQQGYIQAMLDLIAKKTKLEKALNIKIQAN